MKNIFEDENNRPASGNNNTNQPFNQTPNPNQSNQGGQSPMIQISPEQLSAIIAQVMAASQSGQSYAAAPAAPAQPAVSKEPADGSDPGKRVVFQSEDFDNPDSGPAVIKPEPKGLMEVIEQDTELKKSFYDDDDVFDLGSDDNTLDTESSRFYPRETDFGENFSITEKDYPEKELPKIEKKLIIETRQQSLLSSASDNSPVLSLTAGNTQNGANQTVQKHTEASMQIEDFEEFSENSIKDKAIKKLMQLKNLPVSEIIRISVLCVSIIAIVIASVVLMREYKLHNDNKQFEEEVSNLIIEDETTEPDDSSVSVVPEETNPALTEQEQWEQLRAEYPNVIFPPNLQLKYAKLYAINRDFVGYLSAEGIGMSLPIVQTTDDEKYLDKNFYGKTTKYGCPFVTHLNNISTLDMNTVIFGHHMNDGSVFGVLDKYKSIDGFKKAPVITFNTINGDYKWKIIAAFITNAYEKDDNGYVFQYYFTSLSTTERYSAFLNELSQRSLYDTGVDVNESDKILTLSTCSHEFEDARFVVVARLVRPGESEQVNTDNAVVNANVRYPQTYYDKKKLKNPYADAYKWYVG